MIKQIKKYIRKKLVIEYLQFQIDEQKTNINKLTNKIKEIDAKFLLSLGIQIRQSFNPNSATTDEFLPSLQLITKHKTYSQYNQDVFALGIIGNITNGVCVEIGAGDGKTLSNSLFFEESLHWKCILIEPSEVLWEQLQQNRPNCILLNDCISSKVEEVEFYTFEDTVYLSGISSKFHENQLTRFDAGKKAYTKIIQTRTFEDVFDEHNITKVDYLSLDTEGSELECLQGINFDKVDITLMGIEIDYEENFETFENFLKPKGYVFVQRVGGDCFFYKTQDTAVIEK